MTEILMGTALIVILILCLSLLVIGVRAWLSPALPVEVTVNGSMKVPGTTGQKLLNLLNDADIPVPSACAGAGTCGLCKVKVTEGGGPPLPTETARLSRSDLEQGERLACQIVVRAPMAVAVPDDILAAESWTARVVSNQMRAPLIKELVLEVPPNVDFAFRAGTYMQLEAPAYTLDFAELDVPPKYDAVWQTMGWRQLVAKNDETTHRAYSIASRPQDRGKIVFNIRLAVPPPGADAHIPPGIVSSYLFNLQSGDSLNVSGPFGDFGAQETEREMVFIGGGVGMAPLRAMIHEQLTAGTTRKISFWYGARSGSDIFYADEFDKLAAAHENFDWTLALSEPAPEDEWRGATGFIHEVVFRQYLKNHPAPENCEYYLCGPPMMIQAVLAMLDSCGVEPTSIFNDDFGI
ncbi:na(+)-translocating NADH-quinone reductase subunit [Maritalea myrionectae]|uniref:Na(+)-translocating NADH-quinone reductase subunit F n=1 Tax=Maritalea myrionectae TaxID=454601 RepID=A0A2R4MIH9_9HYPH|nr:NADH:ubiquinone reductase (Na(+)-transporting) subunit F [Maritalea myrionectae]AVX05770.1 na(+)-translocating NADH-quinone reductase subunit [Maritalea myrionectae]